MTDDDLKSIFAFLKTLKPVDHFVDQRAAANEVSEVWRRTRRRGPEQERIRRD
jgi:hypothetical protein